MPWKEIRPMDQKIEMITDWISGKYTKVDLSKKYNISRKTVTKWIDRYYIKGAKGLEEQLRSPKTSPHATPRDVIEKIIAYKRANIHRGPRKLKVMLHTEYPEIAWPSSWTIGYWLNKYGLVKPRKKRLRVPAYSQPFGDCVSPNMSWSADYKGQFHLKNGQVCYLLTISDNYSRYLLECEALPGPRLNETKFVFEKVFREYGLPEVIRTDNGTPFAGRCIGGLSTLSIWLIQLGIVPERIEKGKPTQNGRHERMHRTLKAETSISGNLKSQQKEYEFFKYDYNFRRPHEALDQKTPKSIYQKSERNYPETIPPINYDLDYEVRKVKQNGQIKFGNTAFYVSHLLSGQNIGVKEVDNNIWDIYYSFHRLGAIDLEKGITVR